MSVGLIHREKGLIFRITHVDNVAWILDHGLHCRASLTRDPNFVDIGNQELIAKRTQREVPVHPHGTLDDYVPFYFTPWSPMLFNIKTGHQGVPRRPMSEIAILVSSIPRLDEVGVRYVITDRHAYLRFARFAPDASGLDRIDWSLLQSRNFKRDPDHPERFERYQAEALIHQHLPCEALLGIACYDDHTKSKIESLLNDRGTSLKLVVEPKMFF